MSSEDEVSKGFAFGALALFACGIAFVAAVIYGFTWVFFMKTVTVDPGQELVLIDQPYICCHEGVRDEPIREGRVLLFHTTMAQPVTVSPRSITIPFDDLSTADNSLLDFSSTLQFRVTNSVELIRNFGAKWYSNNVQNQYASIVRKAVKAKTMTDMMSNTKASESVDDEVTRELKLLIKENNIPIEILNISLGKAKPNEKVLRQMDETAAQQQRSKTLVEATAAEAKRELEQKARARADNAYRNEMQLDPEQFLQLETAKMFAEACKLARNCIVTPTPGAMVMPTK